MVSRNLYITYSDDDVGFKAKNFLKLIKPPTGDEMTDLNIKLDWDKDTSNKWLVNDAKNSMLAAGYDWIERIPGPVSTSNFKVIFTGGSPVTEFELLEEWMGPALSPGDPFEVRQGVFFALQPPGSTYDKWPVDGLGAILNVTPWEAILVQSPLSDSDFWWRTIIQKVNDTAVSNNKVSLNDNGQSVWYQWQQAQDPDLDPGETIALFKENVNGDPFPLRERMAWA